MLVPGDIPSWNKAISDFISLGKAEASFSPEFVPTLKTMVDSDEAIYRKILNEAKC